MKVFFNNFFHDLDLSPFYCLFRNVFNENIETGTAENSDILFESCFGNNTLLYSKKWTYSFLFLGESDRRLPLFIENGLQNPRLKDYSCILKGKSENDVNSTNTVNFPLFVFYSYSFDFVTKFKKIKYDETRFETTRNKTIIPHKNVCVIISNTNDQQGRNYFIEKLNEKVAIDFAGEYKNNVERIKDPHCSPKFIDFVSKYKVIITMENSKNDNYITEKILEGFAANSIPVYWGANNVCDYFNHERFINVNSFDEDCINEAISKIIEVLNNPELFIDMVNKPIYANNYTPLTLDGISNNVKKILGLEAPIQYKKFITFGGPTSNYHNSVTRICTEAHNLDFFDEIKGFTEKDLQNNSEFWEKHGNFILHNRRGYGYWMWKSFLVKNTLDHMKDNDILIYCDAGCQINSNGKHRLSEYIDMLNSNKDNYGLISFQLEFKEIQYTKRAIFEHFQVNDKNDLQCLATILIIKKNSHSVSIINEWHKNCTYYNLINDYTEGKEDPQFVDNRHDQSILSVLVNKYGSIKLLDETYFHPNWSIEGEVYPFWARRIK